MKVVRYIGVLLFAAAACWRCGEDEKIDIPAQQKVFEEYLADVTDRLGWIVDANLASQYIYRITPGPGGNSRRVAAGDAVTIEYYGFVFDKNKELGLGGLFTTNNPQMAVSAGLTDYPGVVLPPADLTIRQGAGEILPGIDRGLIRAGLRDTVLIYLTSDLSYDNLPTGFLPAGTPTVFEVIIHDINQ